MKPGRATQVFHGLPVVSPLRCVNYRGDRFLAVFAQYAKIDVGNLSLSYDPKEPASFASTRWESEINPELAFASTNGDDQLSCGRILKFPGSNSGPH